MKCVFLVLVLVACGGSPTSPPITATGTVYFKIDAVSCKFSGVRSITFYVANADAGTESLATGSTSRGYPAPATVPGPLGNPVVQARIGNYEGTSALWTLRINLSLSANGSVTHLVTC